VDAAGSGTGSKVTCRILVKPPYKKQREGAGRPAAVSKRAKANRKEKSAISELRFLGGSRLKGFAGDERTKIQKVVLCCPVVRFRC